MKPCKACQILIEDGERFCPRCSSPQDGRDYVFGLTLRELISLWLLVTTLTVAAGGGIGYYIGGMGGAIAGGLAGLLSLGGAWVWVESR